MPSSDPESGPDTFDARELRNPGTGNKIIRPLLADSGLTGRTPSRNDGVGSGVNSTLAANPVIVSIEAIDIRTPHYNRAADVSRTITLAAFTIDIRGLRNASAVVEVAG